MANPFKVVPVLVSDDGPCVPVSCDKMAEQFALLEDGHVSDLFDTRAEAEQAMRELLA